LRMLFVLDLLYLLVLLELLRLDRLLDLDLLLEGRLQRGSAGLWTGKDGAGIPWITGTALEDILILVLLLDGLVLVCFFDLLDQLFVLFELFVLFAFLLFVL